jgi:hypothetical protein
MNARRIVFALCMVAALATSLVTPTFAQGGASKRRIEGTWRVTATFVSAEACDASGCAPIDLSGELKVLITFAPGATKNEGTLVDTNEFQLTPNPVCTPDQGTWQRVGNGQYIATHYNFCFDATADYAPAGPTKIRASLNVSADDKLTGSQFIEGFDAENNLVFRARVSLEGERVHAEAPPAE